MIPQILSLKCTHMWEASHIYVYNYILGEDVIIILWVWGNKTL